MDTLNPRSWLAALRLGPPELALINAVGSAAARRRQRHDANCRYQQRDLPRDSIGVVSSAMSSPGVSSEYARGETVKGSNPPIRPIESPTTLNSVTGMTRAGLTLNQMMPSGRAAIVNELYNSRVAPELQRSAAAARARMAETERV